MANAGAIMKNRWLVVIGAILIQLSLGAIYAWSAYTKVLTDENGIYKLTATQSQWIFSVGLLTFALVMVFAGNWLKKVGPKQVALTGGIILGIGYILAGLLGKDFATQLIFIGLIGGAGIGLAYVCPIAVGVKWFPDKKGLITGLAVAGFGFGATIWVKVANGFFGWPGLINSFDFIANSGVQTTWFIYGVIYLIAVVFGSMYMVFPPDDYVPAGWTPPPAAQAASTGGVNFDQFAMLRTPQFYMIWFCFIAGAMAGLMVIGVIKLFGIDSLQAGGATSEQAGLITSTAMGVFYALANGIGRIAWGMISDKIGRKMAIFLMCLIQGIAMLSFWYVGKSAPMFYLWATIIGFNFGGNFALYPAATADYFGNKNIGMNYGWMFTAYGVGGVIGPVLAGTFKDLVPKEAAIVDKYAAWQMPFVIAGIACIVAAIVIQLTKKPAPPK